MKKVFTLMAAVLLTAIVFAQTPEKMSYQAVIRNSSNALVTNTQVGMKISILQSSPSGTTVYVETQTPVSNANGLVSLEIGSGTVVSGSFSSIEWGTGTYFIKTETDPTGGTNYTITGTSQLLSVPYALHAKTAETVTGEITEADPLFTGWNKDYNDLINTPNIIDSVTTVIDTTSQFIRVPNNLAAGDILVYNGSQFNRLPKGSNNQVLTIKNGYPTWMYTVNISNPDSIYTVYFNSADEDYINFGTFENFTNNSDWCIIEKIKIPTGAGTEVGWHFFRGKAWEDKEGDIAISISSTRVHAWCRKDGWINITYNSTFTEEQWYNICLQYNSSTGTLELYVDGSLVGQQTGISPLDDSGNTNKLFWGGQDVAPSRGKGDIYSETSIIIAHQAWLQRLLTPTEIQNYDGYIAPEPALFFSSEINSNSVSDISGNGRVGTNGNTPEFLLDLP
ncbi:MAG TPA: hypothetical protein P5206_03285 [Paludibacteraceae bacterium]|nr:hypothetical protein [Paludibacteraceae bacterium]